MRIVKIGLLIVGQGGLAWAVVAFVVTPWMRGEPLPWQDPEQESTVTQTAVVDPATRELGPMLPLEGILVNVAETKGRRFFKTSLALEIDGKELEKVAAERVPVLRGAVIDLLSKKTLSELVQPTARDTLRAEILETLNANVSGGQFRDLYFTEFLVQ